MFSDFYYTLLIDEIVKPQYSTDNEISPPSSKKPKQTSYQLLSGETTVGLLGTLGLILTGWSFVNSPQNRAFFRKKRSKFIKKDLVKVTMH